MVKHRGDDICGVLLFDKETGSSSNQVLQRVKRLLNAKKAGHTGSLDPLATGLLPCCFGKSTCLSEYFLASDKRYEAVIQFGVNTDSHDVDGDITQTRPVDFNAADFQEALTGFVGDIEQIPPMVSALKHKGQPLYKLALKGKEVERKPRKMTVYSLQGELLTDREHHAKISVHCSSGFYVRQLAADLGEVLGCGAHIVELRRTASKAITIDKAITWTELQATLDGLDGEERSVAIQNLLLPPERLLEFLPRLDANKDQTDHLSHGRRIDIPDEFSGLSDKEHIRVYHSDNKFLGIGQHSPTGKMKIRRLFDLKH